MVESYARSRNSSTILSFIILHCLRMGIFLFQIHSFACGTEASATSEKMKLFCRGISFFKN